MLNFRGDVSHRMGQTMFFAAVGSGLGVLAWGQYSSPALALLLPLLWVMAPGRMQAFVLTLTYHLAVVRFLPPYAGTWFESLSVGIFIWLGLGILSALAWTLFWPSRKRPWMTPVAVFLALLVTIVSPVALVMPGHPIMGLGFLWQAGGWVAVTAFLLLTPTLAYALVHKVPPVIRKTPGVQWVALLLLATLVGLGGQKLDGDDATRGRVAGRMGTVHTQWGGFPTDDTESVQRVMKMGTMVASLAGGHDGFDTVIFPETIIGRYEPGIHAIIKKEILSSSAITGQTVIMGAEIETDAGRFQNAAIIFRPDGSSSYISARQTTPVANWRPWDSKAHYPADWLGTSTANVQRGVRARIMLCSEEYMPIMHLLSEAREEQQMVIAMANRWASHNDLSTTVQSGHTEGMALLFGRNWLRAENKPKK